jgi:nitrogen fixation protein NifU and related proteins
MYQEIILDHYRHPTHSGLRDPYEAEVHHVNPTCGDEVTLRVHLQRDGEDVRLGDVSYAAQGCSISQASTSVMADLVVGEPLDAAMRLHEEFLQLMQGRGEVTADEESLGDAVAFSGVAKYPARVKCALLGWMAMKDAAASALASVDQGGPARTAGVTTASNGSAAGSSNEETR